MRILLAVILAGLLFASTAPAICATKQAADSASISRVVSSYNDFGFRLFARLINPKSKENAVISPAGISIALAMAYEGSAGTSKAAMAKGLGIQSIPAEKIGPANYGLSTRLGTQANGILDVANSLWVRKGTSLQPAYVDLMQAFYKAHVSILDFSSPDSAGVINRWVKKQTRGKIGSIVGRLDPEDVLLIVNSVYFKGLWQTPFKKSATISGNFTSASGKRRQMKFMHRYDSFSYMENSLFQAVELPYKDGNASLYVFLPSKAAGLAKLQNTLTTANWRSWIGSLNTRTGTVELPRFQINYEATENLRYALDKCGMGVIFDPMHADFRRMVRIPPSMPVFVSKVAHKAIVEVNEEGTVAAAVTGVSASPVGRLPKWPPPKPFEMIVNRPFLFVIRENHTGLILFIGRVTDPTHA